MLSHLNVVCYEAPKKYRLFFSFFFFVFIASFLCFVLAQCDDCIDLRGNRNAQWKDARRENETKIEGKMCRYRPSPYLASFRKRSGLPTPRLDRRPRGVCRSVFVRRSTSCQCGLSHLSSARISESVSFFFCATCLAEGVIYAVVIVAFSVPPQTLM